MAIKNRRGARAIAGRQPWSDFARMSRSIVDARAAKNKAAGKAGRKNKRAAVLVADVSNDRALTRAMDLAVKLGRTQAGWVIDRRQERRKKRSKKQAAGARARKRAATAASGAAVPGVLVAEGDSWFDYPFYDILKILEDDFGYDLEKVSHRGDTVESMAYDGGQLEDFERTIERVIRRGQRPRAILLSGGGNDVSGDGFAMLLNHRSSPAHGLNAAVLAGVVETRIVVAYATILSAVTELCTRLVGEPVPIFLHGYGYPVPDGRGVLGGFGWLPGPWLEPGFREKGYDDLQERTDIAAILIDRFNEALARVAARPGFEHVRVIDLRGSLPNDLALDRYRAFWGNELHPTEDGFTIVAQAFSDLLEAT